MMRSKIFRRRRSASGFTVLEFLAVTAIFLIIAVIVVPLTVKMMVRLRIEGFADQLAMLIQRTRAQAVRENKIFVVSWQPDDSLVPSGPWVDIKDWTQTWRAEETGIAASEAAVLATDDHGLARYAGAPCLDHDGDGVDDAVNSPLFFDGLGAPLTVNAAGRLQSGLVAFCFNDPPDANGNSNVMQVRIDSVAGIVKIAKLIEDPGVAAGERFADESTEKFEWKWY